VFKKSVLFFIVCLCTNQAFANGKKMSTVVVSGTVIKSEQSLSDYTVTKDDISQGGFSSAVDILRKIPGVNVTQQGGQGGLTFVSMRGGDPNFTSVIIDGVRVNDPTNSRGGGFDFTGLDYQLIDKIDVYFGGYSPVFGSEALGGVISVTTLGASEDNQLRVTTELSQHNEYAGSFHGSRTVADTVDLSIAGAYRDGGQHIEGDSLERKQFIFKAQPKYSSQLDWSFSFLNLEGDASSFPEDSGGNELAVIRTPEGREFKQQNFAVTVDFDVNESWAVSFVATQAEHEEVIDNPGIAAGVYSGTPPVLSDSDYRRRDFRLTNTLHLPKDFLFGFGMESTQEEGHFDSTIDFFGFLVPASFSLERDTNAVFGEISWKGIDNLSLMVGVRYDDAEEITETTRRFITNYKQPVSQRSFSFQYSEAFKLPSFFALGHPLVGNLGLKPEQSENLSFDIQQYFYNEKMLATVSLFRNKFTNLVDFDPALFTNVNRSSVIAEGSTVGLMLAPNKKLSIDSHITYTNYQTDPGVKLRRRPEWVASTLLSWRMRDAFSLNIHGQYVGAFYDSSIPTGNVKMSGYSDFDVILTKLFSKQIDVSLALNNVLNNGYQETVGFSNIGRQLRLIAELNF